MNRRNFLIRLSSLISTPVWSLGLLGIFKHNTLQATEVVSGINEDQWRLISVVQEHLFPAEKDSPGARDINAAVYLQSVLKEAGQDPSLENLLQQGLDALITTCQRQFDKSFLQLDSHQRDTVLRTLEQTTEGSNWIRLLLEYILEALLTDPVYGGNPNGIGWRWLQHQPGFPRPLTKEATVGPDLSDLL